MNGLSILIKLLALVILISPTASYGIEESNDKVILVNARGLSHHVLSQLTKSLPEESYLRNKMKLGKVRELEPILGAVTISNLASMETGLQPQEHGIIGHGFGKKENNSIKGTIGFNETFQQKAFWELASEKGKKVLSIGALIRHGHDRNHENVDLIAQGKIVAPGKMIDLNHLQKNRMVKLFDGLDLEIKVDKNSDQLLINSVDSQLVDIKTELQPNKWVEIDFGIAGDLKLSAWTKWNRQEGKSEVYIRNVFANQGKPLAFVQKVDKTLGAAVGWPNIVSFTNEVLGSDLLEEEIYLELDRVVETFNHFKDKEAYKLITMDYPLWDRLGHGFSFDNLSGKRLSKAIARMDYDLGKISEYADSNGFELIVASGHGFSTVKTAVNLNGFIGKQGYKLDKDWEVKAFPSKVLAHIYINTNMEQTKKKKALIDLSHYFWEWQYQGESIVEKVYEKKDLAEIGYDHDNAGDLMVLLKPGYVFQSQEFSDKPLFDKPVFKGDHGYDPKYKESRGFIMAENPNLNKTLDMADEILKILELK